MEIYNMYINGLGMYIQTEQYSECWQILKGGDRLVFQALVEIATEEDVLKMLQCKAPEEGEVMDDDFPRVCTELLPLAYRLGWSTLSARIYAWGYDEAVVINPLCGRRNPLAFYAKEHKYAFAKAHLEELQRVGQLCFDGERCCEDGVYRTLLEELVELDDVSIVRLCIEYGANPNACCTSGRLLDVARSEEMQSLLEAHGATKATRGERAFLRMVSEIRHECLKRSSVNELLAGPPLMKLSWYNSTAPGCREITADLYMETARGNYPELLEELYPYALEDMDDDRRKQILMAILGQSNTLPYSRIFSDRPVDIAKSLEGLYRAGFRFGDDAEPTADHPVLKVIDSACWSFSFRDEAPQDIQLRILAALWKIGGAPKYQPVIKQLVNIAQQHPDTALAMFVVRMIRSPREE